jgi:hypothetical protein
VGGIEWYMTRSRHPGPTRSVTRSPPILQPPDEIRFQLEKSHPAATLVNPNGTALSLITRSFNGNTVRNFPTHGQLSAAQGNLTSCLNFDFAILNLFEPSAL